VSTGRAHDLSQALDPALRTPVPLAFAHGDAFLRNVLTTDAGDLAMVDWEFAGLYPWGWDLAVLWVSATDPDRDAIDALVADEAPGHRVGFIACATVAAARDLHIYTSALRLDDLHPTVLRLADSLTALAARPLDAPARP